MWYQYSNHVDQDPSPKAHALGIPPKLIHEHTHIRSACFSDPGHVQTFMAIAAEIRARAPLLPNISDRWQCRERRLQLNRATIPEMQQQHQQHSAKQTFLFGHLNPSVRNYFIIIEDCVRCTTEPRKANIRKFNRKIRRIWYIVSLSSFSPIYRYIQNKKVRLSIYMIASTIFHLKVSIYFLNSYRCQSSKHP